MSEQVTQTPLLAGCETPRRHKPTRQTSRASYAIGREQFTGRRADVLRWLSHHWNQKQVSPTSAELALFANDFHDDEHQGKSWDWIVLFTRRGLSDLQTVGIVGAVEGGERKCSVSGRTCETWRVLEIGERTPR